MNENTPGPWKVRRIGERLHVTTDETYDFLIADCGLSGNLAVQRDARLMAAAPELLEVCEEALSFVQAGSNPVGAMARMLESAIAKATNSA